MSIQAEAADQVVKIMLDGSEHAIRIAGAGARQLAVLLCALLKDQRSRRTSSKSSAGRRRSTASCTAPCGRRRPRTAWWTSWPGPRTPARSTAFSSGSRSLSSIWLPASTHSRLRAENAPQPSRHGWTRRPPLSRRCSLRRPHGITQTLLWRPAGICPRLLRGPQPETILSKAVEGRLSGRSWNGFAGGSAPVAEETNPSERSTPLLK